MICVDSTCIIDFLKGDKNAVDILNKYQGDLFTTEINIFEVLLGINLYGSEKERISSNGLISCFEILPFGKGCGEISAQITSNLIRKGQMIDQNDCFVAAIMFKNGCDKIITKNKKHFSKIKNLKILSY